ncbi:MAG: amidohydrolase family protein [Negativicutes bacterium]|nr:amidohydrolase family protein [Negativicutes bacterium]
MSELLIRNVRLLDGSGAPWQRGSLLVQNGKIAAMGALDVTAEQEIDGQDGYLTPGFIDIHTHGDRGILQFPAAENYLRQGVTTLIGGNCGGSCYPIGIHRAAVAQIGTSLHYGLLVGHGSIREDVMGMEMRYPTAGEQARMEALTEAAMAQGALGMSFGLYYTPGSYAQKQEVVGLAKAVAKHHGFISIHMRDESDYNIGLLASVEEAIDIARQAEVPLQISHLKCLGKSVWGRAEQVLALLDAARAEGLEISFDQYPYLASGTSLVGALVPGWAQAGGTEAMRQRLQDPALRAQLRREMLANLERRGGPDSLLIAACPAVPSFGGASLKEAAEILQLEPVDAAFAMIEKGPVQIVSFNMQEADLRKIMRHPLGMIGSDGSIVKFGKDVPHPRYYGTFPRVLGYYALQEGVITLAEAVRRMTSAPAARLHLWDRGLLRPGLQADLTLFDGNTVRDNATYDNPHRYGSGIELVVVAGRIALRDGVLLDAKAGTIL